MVSVINIAPLITGEGDKNAVAYALHQACREHGFFYIIGHGISEALQTRLEEASKIFFEQDEATKMQVRMALGGKAWRGYFPVNGELTSGKPDLKEGFYFGTELAPNDPKVQAGWPMHGANLFPENLPELRSTVLEYIDALTQLGHHLMRGLSLSLGKSETYFHDRFTNDPLTLFRIFHYPEANNPEQQGQWGVGEHTDYGVLTILKQDETGGLQVKSKSEWIEAPPIKGSFICNIGDMLDRMTGGYYRSTPHRVRNPSNHGRYSFPFFFDPNFDVEIKPIEIKNAGAMEDDQNERWDGASVHRFEGTYGDYVLGKVSKVFPQLKRDVI